MAIRLRRIDGRLVALCAAKTWPEPGDKYLDDTEHYVLAEKFWRDYPEVGIVPDPESTRRVDAAECRQDPPGTPGTLSTETAQREEKR